MEFKKINSIEKRHRYVLVIQWIMVVIFTILFFISDFNIIRENSAFLLKNFFLFSLIREVFSIRQDPSNEALLLLKDLANQSSNYIWQKANREKNNY
jgi:hypothetical protein